MWHENQLGNRAMMPLAMFAAPQFVGLTLLTLFLYGSLGGLLVLLPFFLIKIEGWPAVAAGTTLFVLPILIFTVLLRKHLLRGITFGAIRK